MTRNLDTDREMIFSIINQSANLFTEDELEQIHEVALKLHEIYKALLARIDNSRHQ